MDSRFRFSQRHTVRLVALMLLLLGSVANVARAQDADLPAGDAAAQSIPDLETQRKAAAENASLDETVRTQIDDLYGKAIERLKEADAKADTTQQLSKELESSAGDLERVQKELSAFTPTELRRPDAAATPADLQPQVTAAQSALAEAQKEVTRITTEIDRRTARRTQLPTIEAQAKQQLTTIEQELAAKPPDDEPAELASARQSLLLARQLFNQRELALTDQEGRTYEATAKIWSLKRDLATRRMNDAERVATAWQDRLAAARRDEADQAAIQARRAAADALPAVREAAERNTALAEENQQTLHDLESTRSEIEQVSSLKDSLENEFEGLQQRAEAANFSQAIGVLLRNQQGKLPDTGPYLQRSLERQPLIAKLNLQLIEWETERKGLVDLDAAVNRTLVQLPDSLNPFERQEIEAELRDVLSRRLELLATAIENGNQYLDRLVALDGLEQGLVEVTETQSDYIAEHVLWVKSTSAVGLSTPMGIWNDGRRLLNASQWQDVGITLVKDLKAHAPTWTIFALVAIWMLLVRGRLRKSVRDAGEAAGRPYATELRPTVRATFCTVALAAFWPGVLWFVGWRLSMSTAGSFPRFAGAALEFAACCYFALEFLRQMLRVGGVAQLHFDWPERSLAAVRHLLRLSEFLVIPSVWIVSLTEWEGDASMQGTIGRLAFVLSSFTVGYGLFRLLRPSGIVSQEIALHAEETLLLRTRPVWTTLAYLAPMVLGILSLIGFHYTALQLTGKLAFTAGLIAGLVLLRGFLNRWLLVTYRRLAIKRNRERREALLKEAAERAESDEPSDIVEPEPIPEVRLSDVNDQTQSLIRLGSALCLVVGLWFIWIDVLPALGILRNVELWPNQIAAAVKATEGESATVPMVTLADLALALAAGLLTLMAARNIPGLMEISILQKLPLDAGARYAASSLTRYAIVILGITLACRFIGIGWSSVQWLIAAMTVGLGFGLQEIFANFVSGLILLFERPVRVGDTVTVNDITGTVTRIRIRATTILDWDNKELIVPNRAFVTDNLINWTLSNPNLRVILGVGIAYGSNTRQATDLLYKVAREHQQVLEDPAPVVVFSEFGDSTLNFELRLFVSGLPTYRRIRHDLNLAIDDEFRQANIEIAFPQRDLHVRSLPADVLGVQVKERDPAPDPNRDAA